MSDKVAVGIVMLLVGFIILGYLTGFFTKKSCTKNLRNVQKPQQPMNLIEKDLILPDSNCLVADNYDGLSLYDVERSQQHNPICKADNVWPSCGEPCTTIYGMTSTDQSIYPGSYLPPALWNTSGYTYLCSEKGAQPQSCFQ